MNLIIDKDNLDLFNFCQWLIPHIQETLMAEINPKKLEKINLYLNKNKIILFNYKEERMISAKNILIGAVYNLRIRDTFNNIIIEINPNAMIPNTSAKFIDIVKLINYGNLSLQEYPIMDQIMNYFAININSYYNKYLKEAN